MVYRGGPEAERLAVADLKQCYATGNNTLLCKMRPQISTEKSDSCAADLLTKSEISSHCNSFTQIQDYAKHDFLYFPISLFISVSFQIDLVPRRFPLVCLLATDFDLRDINYDDFFGFEYLK